MHEIDILRNLVISIISVDNNVPHFSEVKLYYTTSIFIHFRLSFYDKRL